MAEGFEPYHVPQQSRRDKLRVVNNPPGCVDNLQGCAALVPLYDPSLISSDMINCAAVAAASLHHHSYTLSANTSAGVKEEGMNLMGFLGGMNTNPMYVDPSVQLNPSTIQDINGNPYVYASPSCFRPILDQSFHGNEGHNSNNTAHSTGQTLSLSLSSHHSNLPLELNLQRYDSTVFGNNEKVSEGYVGGCNNSGSTLNELSKISVPLGPFTGYASVLKGSRFLRPAQQLLEELCDVGRGIYADKNGVDSSLLDPPPLESLSGGGDDSVNCSDGVEQSKKKSTLLSMLDEVYKRYKQYFQQMQTAVAAFESVAGLSNAAPFANLALKAMSKHFRCLKNAITDQLQFTSKSQVKMHSDQRDESRRSENSSRADYGQRPFHSGFVDHPVWRPQRGLPERAVTVLRAWLFDHFLHPYPTDTDKIMLAKQTGLSRNQVSNWFINARVRLWKPMVEEIHMLETHQSQKASQTDHEQQQQQSPKHTRNDHLPTGCSSGCDNASTSTQRIGELPLKRTREDHCEVPGESVGQTNILGGNPPVGVGLSNGGVSLTLGLYQNGVGLSDTYPINAARRFGLDSHGDQGYVAQNRQFGRDLIDRQIMHDFVG